MKKLCVVHLVRKRNGIGPFRTFLDSYARNRGGIEHDFLVVFKGFGKRDVMGEYDRLLSGIAHDRAFVGDAGFDVGPYLAIAKRRDCDYLCFLNSYSEILDRCWLEKLYRSAARTDVGIAGATGSWESHSSNVRNKPFIRESIPCLGRTLGVPLLVRRVHRLVIRRFWAGIYDAAYDPFPNPHIRSNAFMASREHLLSLAHGAFVTKASVHRFESGKSGLTRQTLEKGLKALVVGKDGVGYDVGDWPSSDTFWQRGQENLLVADNQTRRYDNAAPEERERIGSSAWGAAYRPCRPATQT